MHHREQLALVVILEIRHRRIAAVQQPPLVRERQEVAPGIVLHRSLEAARVRGRGRKAVRGVTGRLRPFGKAGESGAASERRRRGRGGLHLEAEFVIRLAGRWRAEPCVVGVARDPHVAQAVAIAVTVAARHFAHHNGIAVAAPRGRLVAPAVIVVLRPLMHHFRAVAARIGNACAERVRVPLVGRVPEVGVGLAHLFRGQFVFRHQLARHRARREVAMDDAAVQ